MADAQIFEKFQNSARNCMAFLVAKGLVEDSRNELNCFSYLGLPFGVLPTAEALEDAFHKLDDRLRTFGKDDAASVGAARIALNQAHRILKDAALLMEYVDWLEERHARNSPNTATKPPEKNSKWLRVGAGVAITAIIVVAVASGLRNTHGPPPPANRSGGSAVDDNSSYRRMLIVLKSGSTHASLAEEYYHKYLLAKGSQRLDLRNAGVKEAETALKLMTEGEDIASRLGATASVVSADDWSTIYNNKVFAECLLGLPYRADLERLNRYKNSANEAFRANINLTEASIRRIEEGQYPTWAR